MALTKSLPGWPSIRSSDLSRQTFKCLAIVKAVWDALGMHEYTILQTFLSVVHWPIRIPVSSACRIPQGDNDSPWLESVTYRPCRMRRMCRVFCDWARSSHLLFHSYKTYCLEHTNRVSSLDTEQPNEIALRHATMCSTDWPICSLVSTLHPHLCCAIQVTWPMAFCWLGTTKKSLNGHQTPFLVRGWGLGTRLRKSMC